MKKATALVLVLTLVLTVFSGCHGTVKREAFEVPEEFDLSRSYEITFWAKNDTNLSQVQVYRQAIADFQALYPNVMVNLRLYTDYGRLYDDVLKNIGANTPPNVCITYPDHIATYMTGNNCVVPLDDLAADEKYGFGGSQLRFDGPTQEEIVPQFLEEGKIGGVQYAVPYMRSTEACYINKTYVEKLGYTLPEVLTWDFVWEVSDAAMKKNADGTFAVNGQDIMLPFVYKSTDNMMIQMLRQLDAGYSTSGGAIEIFNDTTKSLLYEVADHVQKGSFCTFKIASYPADLLNAGQCIFAVDSTAGATWMGPNAPLLDISPDKVVDFEMEVLPVPQFDPEKPQMISQGPSICIFNQDDRQEVLASWLFAQFLLTNKVQIGYSQTEGYLPVTTKAQNSAEYLDYVNRSGEDNDLHYWVKLEAAKILQDNIHNTFITPVFNGSASLRDAAGQMIESVTRSVRRKETVDEAYFEELYSQVSSLYRLDQVERTDLRPMPTTAICLLGALGGAWICLGVGFFYQKMKEKRKK
ncbi:MAG: extracellular solute-binding protein [Ruminococcaceae bacterium]|nr:extracellular solute-binding protein [Oscillospiraceae bacterium]